MAAFSAPALAAEPSETGGVSVKLIGEFTDMRFTEEHAYGYLVQLWSSDKKLFGILMASEGLVGDTPTGLMEDVTYDPATGRLAFKARLSLGFTRDGQGHWIRAYNYFRFDGVISGAEVRGVFEISDELRPEAAPRREEVVLKKSDEGSDSLFRPRSYPEWKSWVDKIVRPR